MGPNVYNQAMIGPDASPKPLLARNEPPAWRLENPDGAAPVVLVCDHASNRVPRSLDGLGLGKAELRRHIAWDIGAAAVTDILARRLDAVAVLSGYSRLVIDCNRQLDHETSICAESDGTIVPGNLNLSAEDIERRVLSLFHPYHDAIRAVVADRRQGEKVPVVIGIHSFTPEMGGVVRPWHIGVLWGSDPRLPEPLIAALRADGGLTIGDNQPYSGREHYGYTIETHAGDAGLANALIEIREDQIRDRRGIDRYAGLLGDALEAILKDPNLYRVEHYE